MSFNFAHQIQTGQNPFISMDDLTLYTINEHPYFTEYNISFERDEDTILHIKQDKKLIRPLTKCHFEAVYKALYESPHAFSFIKKCKHIQFDESMFDGLLYSKRTNTVQVHAYDICKTDNAHFFLQAIVFLLKMNFWDDSNHLYGRCINFTIMNPTVGYLSSANKHTFMSPECNTPEKIVKDYQFVIRTLLYCILPKYTDTFTFKCDLLSDYIIKMGKHIHSEILKKDYPLYMPPHTNNIGELCSCLDGELSEIFPESLTKRPAEQSLYFNL